MHLEGIQYGIRVSRKKSIAIPKPAANALRIDKGSRLMLELRGDYIVLKPMPGAGTSLDQEQEVCYGNSRGRSQESEGGENEEVAGGSDEVNGSERRGVG